MHVTGAINIELPTVPLIIDYIIHIIKAHIFFLISIYSKVLLTFNNEFSILFKKKLIMNLVLKVKYRNRNIGKE